LAQAPCWLDVAYHESSRTDRRDVPQAALGDSERLLIGMEQGASPLPTDPALVPNAKFRRADLWQGMRVLPGTPGFACAAQQ
uniref:hypothetical protein n=1 Tax=Stenotrophomonas sp. SrG TaxID=3414430 RepID=UPI003CF655DD